MRIAVAGSAGLIGSALVDTLRGSGHTVIRLVRRQVRADDEHYWDPETFGVDPRTLDGVGAVVGLGGVGIGDHRWSGRFKQEIRDSRITPTEVLAEAVAEAGVPVFVSASATGYYGDTGAHAAVETDPAGTGFLADVVRDWEDATTSAAEAGATVTLLRTAPVISCRGGLIGKLTPLFRMGLGATFGAGDQYFSWITLPDEVAAIVTILENSLTDNEITGPVNLCAPNPVRFTDFAKALGSALHRPARLVVPDFVVRKLGGEMAEEMILHSQRVVPRVLTDAGFTFAHPDIDSALEYASA